MRKRQVPHVVRPYLSTSEVEDISGVSRRVLRNYVDKGIAKPINESSDEYYDRWTMNQTVDLQLAQSMRPAGTPLSDISRAVAHGGGALVQDAYLNAVEKMRQNRRTLKAVAHRRRQAQRFEGVGVRRGFYLRYLPQRWMALIPIISNELKTVDTELYVQKFIELKHLVEIVGWSPSYSAGTLMSVSPDFASATSYAFQELSSPPMPDIVGERAIDGGCYRVVDPAFCPQCDASSCSECALFGRKPKPEELRAWHHDEMTEPHPDNTAMLDETEPYATGFWNDAFETAEESLGENGAEAGGPDGREGTGAQKCRKPPARPCGRA